MMDMKKIKVICTKRTKCVCQDLQAGISTQISTPEGRLWTALSQTQSPLHSAHS